VTQEPETAAQLGCDLAPVVVAEQADPETEPVSPLVQHCLQDTIERTCAAIGILLHLIIAPVGTQPAHSPRAGGQAISGPRPGQLRGARARSAAGPAGAD